MHCQSHALCFRYISRQSCLTPQHTFSIISLKAYQNRTPILHFRWARQMQHVPYHNSHVAVSNLVIFLLQCRSKELRFTSACLFLEHFVENHSQIFNCHLNGKSPEELRMAAETACLNICPECHYVGRDEKETTAHCYKTHASRFFMFLEKMGLTKTLSPIKVRQIFV